jgi:cell wall-associated NlpC family hydrolase
MRKLFTEVALVDNWREEVCAEALTWLGTPYVPKARVKGVGVDCGGLLYETYNPFFGPFPAYPQYTADWALHDANGERYLDFIMPYVLSTTSPQPGDFSLFHVGLRFAHAAILLPGNKYIHAWGRLRDGSVTRTPARVMNAFARRQPEFPVKHFTPKV